MGYKAKCKYCGKSIDTNSAYKIVVGKTNRYYCNEEEYNIIHKAQQVKDDTFNLVYDIFGRKVTNTILYKEINELSTIYEYEKIHIDHSFGTPRSGRLYAQRAAACRRHRDGDRCPQFRLQRLYAADKRQGEL